MNSRFSVVGIVCVLGLLLTGCGGGPSKSFVKETFKEDNPTTSVPIDGATLDNRIALALTDCDIFNSYSKKIDGEKIFFYKIRATYEWDVKDHPDQREIIIKEIKKETAYQDNLHLNAIQSKYAIAIQMANADIDPIQRELKGYDAVIKNYPERIKEINEQQQPQQWNDAELAAAKEKYEKAIADLAAVKASGELQKAIDKKNVILAKIKDETEAFNRNKQNREESDVVIPVYVKKVYEHTCSFIEEGNEWRYNIGDGTYIESVTKLSDGTVNKHKGS